MKNGSEEIVNRYDRCNMRLKLHPIERDVEGWYQLFNKAMIILIFTLIMYWKGVLDSQKVTGGIKSRYIHWMTERDKVCCVFRPLINITILATEVSPDL